MRECEHSLHFASSLPVPQVRPLDLLIDEMTPGLSLSHGGDPAHVSEVSALWSHCHDWQAHCISLMSGIRNTHFSYYNLHTIHDSILTVIMLVPICLSLCRTFQFVLNSGWKHLPKHVVSLSFFVN
jgi:hypothetical protein